jgi:O-acetyl-ADP-ribose deacetylase (regulator of RNase III)
MTALRVVEGDITTLQVDAIVNAANDRLAPGGGVCGAIHRAAGPELAQACAGLGGCATGDAKVTPAFALPARIVIHAVGPVWHGGNAGEDVLLAGCYRRALELAAAHDCHSIAFPAISTGIYGFPAERAAGIAVRTVAETTRQGGVVNEVLFCCFDARSAAFHRGALAAIGRESR